VAYLVRRLWGNAHFYARGILPSLKIVLPLRTASQKSHFKTKKEGTPSKSGGMPLKEKFYISFFEPLS
jgi:hypothetical protein